MGRRALAAKDWRLFEEEGTSLRLHFEEAQVHKRERERQWPQRERQTVWGVG